MTSKYEKKSSFHSAPRIQASLPRIIKVQSQAHDVLYMNKPEKLSQNLELRNWRIAMRKILANSNATPIRNHSSLGYKCYLCVKEFSNPADLKQHTIQSHAKDLNRFKLPSYMDNHSNFFIKMDITDLKCNECKLNIATIDELLDHLNNEHDKEILTDIKKMIFPFKFNKDEFRCCKCLTLYNTFKMLQEHMHAHYRNYICNVCSAGFINKNSLQRHEATHGSSGSFKCSHCDKTFDNPLKQKNHESYHGKARNVCRICNERFGDYHKKRKHLYLVHGIGSDDHKCLSCDKSFVSQNSLLAHTKRFHLMLKLHKCKECEMSFFSSSELRLHMIKHTGVKQFQCEVCFRTYIRKDTLKEHLRIHLDDRRFKCKICGQTFIQKCSLKGHLRSKHDGADI